MSEYCLIHNTWRPAATPPVTAANVAFMVEFSMGPEVKKNWISGLWYHVVAFFMKAIVSSVKRAVIAAEPLMIRSSLVPRSITCVGDTCVRCFSNIVLGFCDSQFAIYTYCKSPGRVRYTNLDLVVMFDQIDPGTMLQHYTPSNK